MFLKLSSIKPIALMRLSEIKDPDELLTKYEEKDIIVEYKYDGWRVQIIKDNGNVNIYSRRGENISDNFPNFVKEFNKLPNGCLLEGELVYWDNGKQYLEKVISIAGSTAKNAEAKLKELDGDFKIHLYDILWAKNKNVTHEPFSNRRKILEKIINPTKSVLITKQFPINKWQDAINEAVEMNGEGIVLKLQSKPYVWKPLGQNEAKPKDTMFKYKGSGGKSASDDFVIFKYTISEKNKLVAEFGQYYKGKLYGISKISNFSKENEELIKEKIDKGNYLVVELAFQERIPGGLRHQKFLRFRNDKSPKDATMNEYHVKHTDNFEIVKKASIMLKIAKLEKGDTEKAAEILIDKDNMKLTRGDIAAHYSNPAIRNQIMAIIKDKPIIVYLGVKKNKTVLKRYHNDKKIVITNDDQDNDDSPNNYFYWVNRRLLSIHLVFGKTTKTGFIDLDLHGNFKFETAKKYANEISKVIKSKYDVMPKIYKSGGTGIHIEFELSKEKDIDVLRKELKDLLDEFNKDWENVTTGTVSGTGMRSDISTLHDKGSLRVPGSIGETYGGKKELIKKSNLRILLAKDPLSKYKKIRDFSKTKEPEGKTKGGNKYRFVIQLHDATNKHFDLRLENDNGAMSSWAVPKHKLPKGKERLLAIKTEDHPIEYMKFKGEIPEGEYGAGTVEIYDSGSYEELESSNNKIVFKLNGKKEHGTYKVFKVDKNKWMLMEEAIVKEEDLSTVNEFIKLAILKKRRRKSTGKSEWALVSKKDPKKILRWFGATKPSDERIKEEEKRIQFYKHKKGELLEMLNKIATELDNKVMIHLSDAVMNCMESIAKEKVVEHKVIIRLGKIANILDKRRLMKIAELIDEILPQLIEYTNTGFEEDYLPKRKILTADKIFDIIKKLKEKYNTGLISENSFEYKKLNELQDILKSGFVSPMPVNYIEIPETDENWWDYFNRRNNGK